MLSQHPPYPHPIDKKRYSRGSNLSYVWEEAENLEHLFFWCRRAHVVWKLAPLKWDGLEQESENFSWWWQKLSLLSLDKTNQDTIQLSVYILWMLWKTRNLWVFNWERRSEKEIVDLACAKWHEFCEVQADSTATVPLQANSRIQQKERRRRIAVACTKVYISACSVKQGLVGFGGFVVDDQGRILRAWAMARDQTWDPVAQTLSAIRYAQLETNAHGWK